VGLVVVVVVAVPAGQMGVVAAVGGAPLWLVVLPVQQLCPL
jgi:hypothetical protein